VDLMGHDLQRVQPAFWIGDRVLDRKSGLVGVIEHIVLSHDEISYEVRPVSPMNDSCLHSFTADALEHFAPVVAYKTPQSNEADDSVNAVLFPFAVNDKVIIKRCRSVGKVVGVMVDEGGVANMRVQYDNKFGSIARDWFEERELEALPKEK